jgi:hypothetical protein
MSAQPLLNPLPAPLSHVTSAVAAAALHPLESVMLSPLLAPPSPAKNLSVTSVTRSIAARVTQPGGKLAAVRAHSHTPKLQCARFNSSWLTCELGKWVSGKVSVLCSDTSISMPAQLSTSQDLARIVKLARSACMARCGHSLTGAEYAQCHGCVRHRKGF